MEGRHRGPPDRRMGPICQSAASGAVPFVLGRYKKQHHPQEETACDCEYTDLLVSSSMATTPFFLWATKTSSSTAPAAAVSDHDVVGIGAEEDTAAAEAPQHSPELAAAVARPRLRRQASAPAKQKQHHQAGGGSKKPPQRGLGVAELERLRCGGDPLRDLNFAVAAMGDAAAAANVHGLSFIHNHLQLTAYDADTDGRHYAPLLVRPAPPPPPPAPAPFCYLHSSSSGGHNVAPELQFLRDRCMVGSAGAGHQPQLLPLVPEHPSSQSNTIWRPAYSSSCLPTGHRCDLCSKTMVRALTERGARGATTPGPVAAAAAATTTTPDYSIYDLAAAMATARKEKGQGLFFGRERKNDEAAEKEVREIEFFPTSTSHPDESEFAAPAGLTAPFSSSAGGGCGVPLDLSLRL